MTYDSLERIQSRIADGVTYLIPKISFARRMELMRQVREVARKAEYLEAGQTIDEKMEAALLQGQIDRLYLTWGLKEISGLELDGKPATPESLIEWGPEELCREALEAVRAVTRLSADERKN